MFIPVRLDGPVSRVHPDGGVLLVVECPEVAAVPGKREGESQWRLAGTHLSPQAQDRLDTTHQGDNTAPEHSRLELQTIHRFSKSWRRPLQGPSRPSPGWKHLLVSQ